MTRDQFLTHYRPGSYVRSLRNLGDFLGAVAVGEDLWNGRSNAEVHWSTQNAAAEYTALKALGWSAGSDYGNYGSEWLYVYSPHTDS